jgi:hypothetical protein
MKLKFSRQIFEKSSNIKFHENPSRRSRVIPYGRTDGRMDRHDEANSRFSQFFERAYKLYFLPTECVSVFSSDISTNSDDVCIPVSRLEFVTQTKCVYRAVRPEALHRSRLVLVFN